MAYSRKCRLLLRDAGLALGILWLLTGCAAPPKGVFADAPRTSAPNSETPVSANFRTNPQLKLQAAQHWASIAEDTGQAIVKLLRQTRQCGPQVKQCKAVFVNPPARVTEFSRAFHNQLITTLVSAGLLVSKSPDAATTLDIDVQPVVFAPNRPQYRFAGTATELGPGIWALRDAISVNPSDPKVVPPQEDSLLPRGDALHWFRTEFAAGQTPQTEILVTVSAGDPDRYLARNTNVYYITDGDKRLYDQEICSLIASCPNAPKEKKLVVVEVVGDCPLDRKCCGPEKCCPANQPCVPEVVEKAKPKPVKKK